MGMRRSHREDRGAGFTLVETLVAMWVLVTGVVAVAQLFAWSTSTVLEARRQSEAMDLASLKLEELRLRVPLAPGGGLDPAVPVGGYSDYLTEGPSGWISAPAQTGDPLWLRTWQVGGTQPSRVGVAVYLLRPGAGRNRPLKAYLATSLGERF